MAERFLLQIIILFIIFIALDWVRVIVNKFIKKNFKLRLIDVVPVLALIFIHELTVNVHGFSWDGPLIIGWALFGILILIHKSLVKQNLTHRNFYLTLWRVGDIYLLVAWLFAGVSSIF